MKWVNVYEAKTQFSQLLRRVAAGEEIVIAKGNQPVARLVPFGSDQDKRVLGTESGRIQIAADFDAPLPDDILEDFEGAGPS
jgi:prevent-host-death family protein